MINCFAHMLSLRARIEDLRVLWPRLLHSYDTLEDARSAFRRHAFSNSNWLALAPSEIHEVVDSLGKAEASACAERS